MLTTIFVLLLLGGVGFPMPEEIPLLLGGVAAAEGVARVEIIFLICYAGVLIGDQTMYFFGYFFGRKILNYGTQSPFLPSITEDKVNEVREGLRKRRLVYLFVGRHLFVLRSVTFIVAGSLRIPYLEFFLADGAAALFSVSIFMGLGYLFGKSIDTNMVQHITHQANYYIIGALVLGGGFYLIMRRIRAGKEPQPLANEITPIILENRNGSGPHEPTGESRSEISR